uniref:Uncharacterized protein n=1 Tax=viral metagenome TaxID=1070528 RepID=A0A6H1ZHF1_9ZZZZ
MLNEKYYKRPEETIEQYYARTPTPDKPGDILTGDALIPQTDIPFVNPNKDMFTSMPTTPEPTPMEPTTQETNISQMIQDLTATSGIAGEEAAYRAQQEEAAGIEPLRAAEADYTAQLTQLQADYTNVENRMQLQAEGRGITAGGLATLTMAEQRRLSIQANTVSALLAATQGKITYAQSQVDRTVNAKYAQAKAERQAKIDNLELLLKDPTLTVEQKNRADAQMAKQKKEEKADDKKEKDATTIMNWATDAAANGATPQQAQAIAAIGMSDNPDVEQAFALYSPFAKKAEAPEVTADLRTFKQFFPDVDVTTPEGRQQYLDWKARVAAAGRAPAEVGLQPSEGFFDPKIEGSVREDFTALSSEFAIPANPTEEEAQEAFRKLRGLYSPQEATDEALKNLIGIVPKEEILTEPATEDVADSWLSDFVSIFTPERPETPEAEINEFGTGQFADKNIDDRIAQLKESLGKLATKKYLEEQLLKDGYTPDAIKKRTRTKFLGIF